MNSHVLMWQGPVYELVIAGGTCTEDPSSGVVTCSAPSVELTKMPGACNLKYTSPDIVQVTRKPSTPSQNPDTACKSLPSTPHMQLCHQASIGPVCRAKGCSIAVSSLGLELI